MFAVDGWRPGGPVLIRNRFQIHHEFAKLAEVFFTLFCFINVITGIFVDNAKAASRSLAHPARD